MRALLGAYSFSQVLIFLLKVEIKIGSRKFKDMIAKDKCPRKRSIEKSKNSLKKLNTGNREFKKSL